MDQESIWYSMFKRLDQNKNHPNTTPFLSCISPPEVFYGVYLPLAFILAVVILITVAPPLPSSSVIFKLAPDPVPDPLHQSAQVFLRHDWTRDRSLFTHITKGNIR